MEAVDSRQLNVTEHVSLRAADHAGVHWLLVTLGFALHTPYIYKMYVPYMQQNLQAVSMGR